MKLFGILLVFTACVFGGAAAAERYRALPLGAERAERLVAAMISGIKNEHGTLDEILHGVLKTDEKTDEFVSSVLKSSAGKRIVLKKGEAAKIGFCRDEAAAELLEEAFEIFGKTAAQEQIKSLEHVREKLAERQSSLSQPCCERAKLARSFGVIAGFLAAVILI